MIFLLGATRPKDCCRSRKVQSAPDHKRSRLLNQLSLLQGGLYSWSNVMETQRKPHTHTWSQEALTPQIYGLLQKAIKVGFCVSQHTFKMLNAHRRDLCTLHVILQE